jgi:hypothetical protein
MSGKLRIEDRSLWLAPNGATYMVYYSLGFSDLVEWFRMCRRENGVSAGTVRDVSEHELRRDWYLLADQEERCAA